MLNEEFKIKRIGKLAATADLEMNPNYTDKNISRNKLPIHA